MAGLKAGALCIRLTTDIIMSKCNALLAVAGKLSAVMKGIAKWRGGPGLYQKDRILLQEVVRKRKGDMSGIVPVILIGK